VAIFLAMSSFVSLAACMLSSSCSAKGTLKRLRLHFLEDALFFQEVVESGTGTLVTFRHIATP
jgi:hypothetical protein